MTRPMVAKSLIDNDLSTPEDSGARHQNETGGRGCPIARTTPSETGRPGFRTRWQVLTQGGVLALALLTGCAAGSGHWRNRDPLRSSAADVARCDGAARRAVPRSIDITVELYASTFIYARLFGDCMAASGWVR